MGQVQLHKSGPVSTPGLGETSPIPGVAPRRGQRLTEEALAAVTPLGDGGVERLPEVLRGLAKLAEHNPALALLHLRQLGLPSALYGFAVQRVDLQQTGPVTQQDLPEVKGDGLRLTLDPKVQAAWEVSAFGLKSFIQPNVRLDFGDRAPRISAKDRAEVFKLIAAEVRGAGPNDRTFWEHRSERAARRIMEQFPKLEGLELRLHVAGYGEVKGGEGLGSVRDRTSICHVTRGADGALTTQHSFEVREAHRALQIMGQAVEPRGLYYRTHYRGQSAEGPDYWVLQRFVDQALIALAGGPLGTTGLGLKDAQESPLLKESEADRRAFTADLKALQGRVKARVTGGDLDPEACLKVACEEIARTLQSAQHPALVEVRRTVGAIELGSDSVAAMPYGGERQRVPEPVAVGPFSL